MKLFHASASQAPHLLQLLEYETRFCIPQGLPRLTTSDYFALPSTNVRQQFAYVSRLVEWALKLCGASFIEWEYDDPNTAATNMLMELKKIGFEAEMQQVASLKTGSGAVVCDALQFVLWKAVQHQRMVISPPNYQKVIQQQSAGSGGGVVDDDDTDGPTIAEDFDAAADDDDVPAMTKSFNEDNDEDGDDDELMYSDLFHTTSTTQASPDGDQDNEEIEDDGDCGHSSLLKASVDPNEWKLELERVGASLKFKTPPGAKEWQTHLEQAQKHERRVQEGWTSPGVSGQLQKLGDSLVIVTLCGWLSWMPLAVIFTKRPFSCKSAILEAPQ